MSYVSPDPQYQEQIPAGNQSILCVCVSPIYDQLPTKQEVPVDAVFTPGAWFGGNIAFPVKILWNSGDLGCLVAPHIVKPAPQV